jgi:hypothetical protein
MSFVTTTVTLASAVANAGTVDIAYPAGTTQATFTGTNAAANTGFVVLNDNETIPEAASGTRVGISYGADDITITNNSGVTWPVGSKLRVQLGVAGNDRPAFQKAPAIAALTDSSGGTAATTLPAISGSYTQAEVRNSVASLNAQINRILVALRAEGIIAP